MATSGQIRVPNVGPFIQGEEDGDILVWNNTTKQWELGSASGLPDGDYIGQPLAWDESGWIGRTSIEVAQVSGHGTPPFGDPNLLLQSAGGNVTVESTAGSVAVQAGDTYSTWNASGLEFRVFLGGDTAVQIRDNAGQKFRIFDNDPPTTGRVSITGATTQEALDQVIAALVAWGWATDDRVP
jgi:hypothetical protein